MSKRSKARIGRAESALEQGATLAAAAAYAGIDAATLRRWRGDDPALRERLEQAQLKGEVSLVQILRRAAEEDWRAAAWLLTHRWPGRWSERRTVTLKHEGEQPPTGAEVVADMLRQLRERDDEQGEEPTSHH